MVSNFLNVLQGFYIDSSTEVDILKMKVLMAKKRHIKDRMNLRDDDYCKKFIELDPQLPAISPEPLSIGQSSICPTTEPVEAFTTAFSNKAVLKTNPADSYLKLILEW